MMALGRIKEERVCVMNVGDRVRIKESVVFYHHPLHRNEAFDAKGLEGTIVKILTDYKGRPISPNFPVVVECTVEGAKRPFKAHLKREELETL
jgi:hypothetical protein